ncbi:MAG: biotin-dependent carboxyltransferase family protein [Candidatus Marinimicrobia bacterium]|nr:biotin-dependent carboxyltransferase family protein [Candidatus Neomarinimicrobiota bacterium]
MSISVLQGGLQSTVQNLGRYGYTHFGISASGAGDQLSLRIGNLLVGNPDSFSGLEMTLIGGKYQFNADAFIALSGSEFHVNLDGDPFPFHNCIYIRKGQILYIGGTKNGARCYLSVRGGFDVPKYLSGTTTHVMSGLGGFKGRPLQKGDELKIGSLENVSQPINIKQTLEIDYHILRITNGLQSGYYDDNAWESFTTQSYTVSENSSRMGVRLQGEPIRSKKGNEILTEGIPLGAIQIPGGGEPIISFVEHQTTGGYPKMANVITADMCKVGQLKPGDLFKFQRVTIEEAEKLRLKQESYIQKLKNGHD